MATTRIIPMHINKGKTIAQCLKARVEYVKNPDKTDSGELISSYACSPETADQEFLLCVLSLFMSWQMIDVHADCTAKLLSDFVFLHSSYSERKEPSTLSGCLNCRRAHPASEARFSAPPMQANTGDRRWND